MATVLFISSSFLSKCSEKWSSSSRFAGKMKGDDMTCVAKLCRVHRVFYVRFVYICIRPFSFVCSFVNVIGCAVLLITSSLIVVSFWYREIYDYFARVIQIMIFKHFVSLLAELVIDFLDWFFDKFASLVKVQVDDTSLCRKFICSIYPVRIIIISSSTEFTELDTPFNYSKYIT